MFPRPLLRFLSYARANSPAGTPIYFGNNRISDRSKFCGAPHCLLRSAAWQALTRNQSGHRPLRTNGPRAWSEVSYAQGGFYGFNRAALTALTRDNCMEAVASTVDRYKRGLQLFEDETVGLCMHLRRVPLLTCNCFYDWGPCNIGDPTTCRADTNETRLCRLPLSVHKLRELAWYDGWWTFIAGREQAGLKALDRWETAHRRSLQK